MTRYGLSLKMDCDNAAFSDDRAAEVARILRRVADNIERGGGDYCALLNSEGRAEGWLYDANGNSCGSWDAKPRRIRD